MLYIRFYGDTKSDDTVTVNNLYQYKLLKYVLISLAGLRICLSTYSLYESTLKISMFARKSIFVSLPRRVAVILEWQVLYVSLMWLLHSHSWLLHFSKQGYYRSGWRLSSVPDNAGASFYPFHIDLGTFVRWSTKKL